MRLQNLYKGDYLLQVWSKKGEVEYERMLKCNFHEFEKYIDETQHLLTVKNYLIYIPDKREEGGERYIYVV